MATIKSSSSSSSSKLIALVTGGNAGIGLETCKGLAKANFHVIIGARSQTKGNEAIQNLIQEVPGSTAETLILDLASFESVRAAAKDLLDSRRKISVCSQRGNYGFTVANNSERL